MSQSKETKNPTRKRELISRRYLTIVLLDTLPFWYLAVMHVHTIITSWENIY